MGRMEEPYRCFAFQIYQELERLHKYLYKMFQKSEVMFLGPQTEKNRELVTC
jgi:phosphate uptake regulator